MVFAIICCGICIVEIDGKMFYLITHRHRYPKWDDDIVYIVCIIIYYYNTYSTSTASRGNNCSDSFRTMYLM